MPHAALRLAPALVLCASLVATWGCADDSGGTDAPPVPDLRAESVLLFTVDTLRSDLLGPYGGTLAATPHADRLAAESVVFDRAYSQATLTHPALSSMLTGLVPYRHGVHSQNNKLAVGVGTLAERLQAEGVATGSFVANLCKLQDVDSTVFREGWDEVFCGMDDATEQHRWDTAVVDAAQAWIAQQDGPWFAWVHLMDPHAEHRPQEDYWDYAADPPRAKQDQYVHMNQWEVRRELPPEDEYERLWKLYAAEVEGSDRELGRMLDFVDGLPVGERTAVLFSSDHGEELYETWSRYDHGFSMTEGVLWVPLMVRAPGLAPGRVDEVVETLQVTPTVLGLFDLEAGERLDGWSLLSSPAGRGFATSYSTKVSISMRTREHRYWLRTTRKPWTRPPDQAPWRADAPWFRQRKVLAGYADESEGARTSVEWLPLNEPANKELAKTLRTELDAFMEALGPLPKTEWIRNQAVDDQLEDLGYVGGEN